MKAEDGKKNPAAVALGRKGGKARMKAMTPKQRSEAATHANRLRWAAVRERQRLEEKQKGAA